MQEKPQIPVPELRPVVSFAGHTLEGLVHAINTTISPTACDLVGRELRGVIHRPRSHVEFQVVFLHSIDPRICRVFRIDV